MKRRIGAAWEQYREQVLPANAGQAQIDETRKGFYAGAAALFGIVAGGVSPGNEVEPSDLAMLDDLVHELQECVARIQPKGRPS